MILNLTQYVPTPEQQLAGVVDVEDNGPLKQQLTILISGDNGLGRYLKEGGEYAAAFLQARMNILVQDHVWPVVAEQAVGILDFDGYAHVSKETAMSLLRPEVAAGGIKALIGPSFYAKYLIIALERIGVQPVYALSERIVQEVHDDEGKVIKTSAFKHVAFIDA